MELVKKQSKLGVWKHLTIPTALIGSLSILLFPLPTGLLDVCLAFNITTALVIMFVTLYIEKPLSFSAFPAILLVTTMFRLSMNVAATRLILLHGENGMSAAGEVIRAFGEFVVGGNYAVGFVVFILVSIVNLKVITKGSGRIAEVAARFTLDAMPGKQMAIDSDLNTGLINEADAKRRRKELSQEAEFYGAMDGAAKFVSGDAQAGVIIMGINIIGGFFIGIMQKNMDWMHAAQTYSILTIGDGLVSQIPAIIISTASGLIVARAASGEDLNTEVLGQLTGSTKPLFITSLVCLGFAIIPGLPAIPFLALAAGTAALGQIRSRAISDPVLLRKKEEEAKAAEVAKGPKPGSTEEVMGLLGVDTLELEVGYELVSLVEGGDLVERIRSLRRQIALDYGFVMPAIHIRDNVRIKSNEYRLLLKGGVIGRGELKMHYLLAMDPGNVTSPIEGTATKEPAFGLDALWIHEGDKERAQFAGYTVVDLSTVITTHLTELIRSNMAELITRQDVQILIDNIQKDSPKLIEELIPGLLTIGQVQQCIQHLLREQISIRDLKTVLETLADWAPHTKQTEKLAEYVRRKLARNITAKFLTADGVLPLASLNPNLERALIDSVQQGDDGSFLSLEPGHAQQLINRLNKTSEKFAELGHTPLVLAPGHLRASLAKFASRFAPGVSVISHHEIAPNTKVQSLGVVSIEGGA